MIIKCAVNSQTSLAKPVIRKESEVTQYLGVCQLLQLVAWVLVAVVSGSPYKGTEGGATSCVTQSLRVQVVVNELLALDDVLCVLAVVDGAGHLLLLLVVHLGVDAAVSWKLPEKQWGIGILSPKPRTVGFIVFMRWGGISVWHFLL